ncbi:receptor-like cytoplasmic kinase 1 [Salvia hispanica]|uniref:receptor-like cytoplasmic kinase 1 n=1 Tax=Salvia hispanica TaxID=49212 RepID=UPI0020093C00|nr:receptor-like cytoplasmic kinase 1 [Salvia hispanica]
MKSSTSESLFRQFSLDEATGDFSEEHVIGSTAKDQNEIEVDKLSKAFPTTAMKEDDVPFILFGETNDIVDDMYNFARILKNGEDATIERIHYMPKHVFEFRAKDSETLSFKHENVVELVVYSLDGSHQVLAYDFAPRGSLHDILHQQQGTGSCTNPYPALTWYQRVQIALGVARGLCCIHSYGSVHHNINSRNILVCGDETAKIMHPNLWAQCYCQDYFSENISHPKLKDDHGRGDVYNFGVILLELLTGGKILGEGNLVTWALPQLDSNKVHEIVDARLEGEYPHEAVKKMAKVAQSCLEDEGYYRRKMVKVVQDLELCLGETKSTETQIAS